MISEEQLAELESITNNATPGPWYICNGAVCHNDCPNGDEHNCPYRCEECLITEHEDIMFVVTARDAVPLLINEVKYLKRLVHWFIYEGWDCPRMYGTSVVCRRYCPIYKRHEHDNDKDWVCTSDEILEFAESDLLKEMEDSE